MALSDQNLDENDQEANLRKEQQRPVILVVDDEEKIREGGCEDYISKPISVSHFIEVIEKHLV